MFSIDDWKDNENLELFFDTEENKNEEENDDDLDSVDGKSLLSYFTKYDLNNLNTNLKNKNF